MQLKDFVEKMKGYQKTAQKALDECTTSITNAERFLKEQKDIHGQRRGALGTLDALIKECEGKQPCDLPVNKI